MLLGERIKQVRGLGKQGQDGGVQISVASEIRLFEKVTFELHGGV